MGSAESAPTSEEESQPAQRSFLSEDSREDLLRQLRVIAASRAREPSADTPAFGGLFGRVRSLVDRNELGVRPLRVDSTTMDDEDGSSTSSMLSDDEEDLLPSNHRPTPQCFCVPNQEPYSSSYRELHSDIARQNGYLTLSPKSPDRKIARSVNDALRIRELCLRSSIQSGFRCGGLSGAERVNISERFFPNKRKLMDTVRAKTFCVGYTDGGLGLMTASQDHKIRLYERYGPRGRYFLKRSLDVPYVGWSILDVVVSPDGRDLVYSTWNEAMYQCSVDDLDENWVPLRVEATEARFALFSIRFNATGTEIVAGSTDQHLYIYNREVASCILALKVHDDDVNAVCFGDESSNIILSGADDGLVKVWDRRRMGEFGESKPVGTFAGHHDGITFIDSRNDNRYVLSNSKDQTIKVWDMRHFATEAGVESTRSAVRTQEWDYRWQCMPTDNMKQKRLPGDCSVLSLRGHSVLHTLVRARFSPPHTGQRYIYTGCGRGNCVVYDLYSGNTKAIFGGHRSVVRDCAWSPVDNEIVAASWDGETSVWRYDERADRNINPDGKETGDEDSCDEGYGPIRTRSRRDRRYGSSSPEHRKRGRR